MANNTNLDVGKIKGLMQGQGLGNNDLGYKMGVSGGMIKDFLSTGEAPPEHAARMAAALGRTITEISVA